MKKAGKDKAIFAAKKIKAELVYHMAKSEGNSLTYAETETVLQGISVSGRPVSDVRQVDNIGRAWDELIRQVEKDIFMVNKDNFILLNSLCAESENPQIGQFRDIHVRIGGTRYTPPLPMELSANFRNMIATFEQTDDPVTAAIDLFLTAARHQFFADGNKRTAQLMMNGHLMQHGYLPISIGTEQDVTYKSLLITFYESGDKTVMQDFLLSIATDTAKEWGIDES